MYYLFVTECGLGLWIPVDHLYPTVDEALLIQLIEYPYYRSIVFIIHGKVGTVPVEGAAQLF